MEMLLSVDFALRVGVAELRSHCECWALFSILFILPSHQRGLESLAHLRTTLQLAHVPSSSKL